MANSMLEALAAFILELFELASMDRGITFHITLHSRRLGTPQLLSCLKAATVDRGWCRMAFSFFM